MWFIEFINHVKDNIILNNMNNFEDEIKNSFIFHIPHSSLNIPDTTNMNLDLISQDSYFQQI